MSQHDSTEAPSPGAPEPEAGRAELRRAAFLGAARDVFLEFGYEQANMAEIVRRAGGSLSTLYAQFGGKKGLFEAMIAHLREAVTAQLMRVEIVPPEEQAPVLPPMEAHKIDPNTGEDEMAFAGASLVPATAAADRDPKNPASWGKVGRNEACPCGSGKKYKHCHGAFA